MLNAHNVQGATVDTEEKEHQAESQKHPTLGNFPV